MRGKNNKNCSYYHYSVKNLFTGEKKLYMTAKDISLDLAVSLSTIYNITNDRFGTLKLEMYDIKKEKIPRFMIRDVVIDKPIYSL
jgi:hypothetical protein